MRYHSKKPDFSVQCYGIKYRCNHPVYSVGTLYLKGRKGLVIIQQKRNEETKMSWWGAVDFWIANEIYVNPKFPEYFDKLADEPVNSLYPTVTVRQAMWALRIKPLKKEIWETVFDRRLI